MKLNDIQLEEYNNGGIEIYLDEEYFHHNWWNSYEGLTYVYSRDKEQDFSNSDPCITMRIDRETEGYFIPRRMILRDGEEVFAKFDRYIELLEFCVTTNDKTHAKTLFDYLLYYARVFGAKFVRIGKGEVFEQFYLFAREYRCLENESFIYVFIDNPIDYEEYEHLRTYDGDGLDFDDLYYLNLIFFRIGEKSCDITLFNETLSIDRATKKISFPSFVLSDDDVLFTKERYSLIKYIVDNASVIKDKKLHIDFKIKDVPIPLCAIENETLIAFSNITELPEYRDILSAIKRNTQYKKLEIFTTKYLCDFFSWIGCKQRVIL